MEGWIKLHRRFLESPIFTSNDAGLVQLWIYILLKINHEPKKVVMSNQIIELDKGQGIFGLNHIVRDLTGLKNENGKKFKSNKIRQYRRLILLEKLQSLKLKPTNKYTVITVLNWDQYQSIVTQMKLSRNTAVTQMLTNKNVKNGKNILNNGKLAKPVDLQTSIQQKLEKRQPRTQWEEKAFRYADALSIDLSGDIMGRWLKIFRDADQNGGNIKLDRAYSYLRDYQKPITNDGKVKLFFWAYAHNGGINS